MEQLPKGWKIVKLRDVAEIKKEVWKPTNNKILPYLGLEHIAEKSLRLISLGNSKQVKSQKFIFTEKDFLFGKLRPYFRKLYKPNFKGVCSTDIWVVSPKNINRDFLFYLFATDEFIELATYGASGTRMPRADWNFLKETEWIIPESENEQHAIAEVLSSLDDKIDLLHRLNQTLEQLAETLFRQYFIENPNEEWEERPLDKIASFLNGLPCQKYPPKNKYEKLPVLKIKELRLGYFTENSDWATNDVPKEYIIKSGDVIFSWSGSLLVKIWGGEDCVLNQHLFKVSSKKYPKWFYYLWTKFYLKQFISIAESKATTMGHIKRSDLSNALVVVPSKTELETIDKIFTPLIDKIINNNKQIRTLEQLRDTLLPKLMSGEVRVKF